MEESINAEVIAAMREWVADCEWADIDGPEGIDSISDAAIIKGVQRYYAGGVVGFLLDTNN